MSEDVTVTMEVEYTKNQLRAEVMSHFDVEMFTHVANEVFGDQDLAPGTQNSTMPSGSGYDPLKEMSRNPDHEFQLATHTQIPSQVMHMFGPVKGCVWLADSLIMHASDCLGEELWDRAKASLIYQVVEKYGFNMTIGERAAVEAVEQEFGYTEARRTLKQRVDDESKGGEFEGKADAVFTNGKTMQAKVNSLQKQGCDIAAKIELPDNYNETNKVLVTLEE